MAEITVHIGLQGDQTLIHIDWFDHNNVQHKTDINVQVLDRDKPRTLLISIDDVNAALQISDRDGKHTTLISSYVNA